MAAERYKSTATISSGAALSNAVFLGTGSIMRLEMPSAWTAAGLSFQVSSDGTNFKNLYDGGGSEVLIASGNVAADRAIRLDPQLWVNVLWLKIRSGSSAAAVNQAADRDIVVVKKP